MKGRDETMEEQEKKLSRFSKLAAWTEYELADLCLGLMPDRGRADNEERNEVLESIHRAAEMGELQRKTNSLQPLSLNQYRTSTYYPRSDATRWAAANFPETFPFMPESGGTTGQEEVLGYSTPLLAILNAAIAKFFDPRRNPDAKRDEVVEWIKSKMIAAEVADSDNIATAIFTIIKPENHDPRKRRG